MKTLSYRICDVFTDRPLTGNALAVFTDANDLDTATMQALAREMNLSESAFVLAPTAADADARVRIFTPTMELPFAGHPTLGTAFVLGASMPVETLRLQTDRGIVPIRLSREGSRVVFGWMSQPIPRIQRFSATGDLLAALGVERSRSPIELYDNGPKYVFVELGAADEVAALRPDLGRLAAGLGTTVVSVFARKGESWKCRVFAPGEGIPEDPATGAAAGPLAVHLARYGHIRFGDEIRIEQGLEIGRPSLLHARALGTATVLEGVEVGGAAVVIGGGELRF